MKSLVLSRTRPRTSSRPRSLSRLSWSNRPEVAGAASHLEFAESRIDFGQEVEAVAGTPTGTVTRGRVRYRQTEGVVQPDKQQQRRSLSVLSGRVENQLLPCTLSTAKFSQTPEPKQVTFVPVRQKLPQQSVVHLRSLQGEPPDDDDADEGKKLPTQR